MNIEVENLVLRYGPSTAIDNLDLTVADGEAVVLLGQSGCGKTSTMRCIAGLEEPASGSVRIGGDYVFNSERGIDKPSHQRNIGMVFQSYAIWPHLTVFENVAFPLTMKKTSKADTRQRVTETLKLVGLDHLADRGASLLSGGQMQRVALARSLVMQPSVLLLDEPLSNLDARLRDRLRIELRELQLELGLTSIYVTHDQDEALALADRIALMQQGRIVQIGTPREIYGSPRSASIADFLGVSNIIPATPVDGSTVMLAGSGIGLKVDNYDTTNTDLKACIRAEDLELVPGELSGMNSVPGKITVQSFQGPTVKYHVKINDELTLDVLAPKSAALNFKLYDEVSVRIPADGVQVLPSEVVAA
jgi:iron(III) transport system ATP-binding protein